MSEEVAMVIMFFGIVAGALLCWGAGYSDGYKFGRDIGRDEGVVLGLRRAISIMRKGGDAE